MRAALASGLLVVLVSFTPPAAAQITDGNGFITSDNWLALGPFANPFGCSGIDANLTTLHIAPSFIQCQYPEEGDAVPYDPAQASTFGLNPLAPFDPDSGDPVWYLFDDGTPDCDLDMDATTVGGVSDHVLYVATYVEFLGVGGDGVTPMDADICGNSDDGLQVWWDDQLVINQNACRGRGGCAGGTACDSTPMPVTVEPGVHRILMGVWERAGGFGGSLRLIEPGTGAGIVDGVDPDWVFHGTEPAGDLPDCTEPPLRTIGAFTCPPAAPIQVTIRQTVPPGADPAEVITVVETVTGEFDASIIAAANGGTVSDLAGPPVPAGQFGDHRNIVVNPICTPNNGDTVEGPPGVYTVTNTGEDIWQGGDTFQFAYNRVQGDFDVSVHVVERTPSTGSRWGKHGIMARQTLHPRSRYSWTHDAIGDVTTATHNNDDSTRHATRPTHLGADNFEETPFATNPSGDNVDDYCDGVGPDDGRGCATARCPDAREAAPPCVVHDDYLRLVRTGSLFESYSRADPADPWTFLGDHDWGAGAPDEVLVGLAATSHSTDCASQIEIVFDEVDYGGATILSADPQLGARIEWSVTRAQLATGISYTIDLERGQVGFSGEAAGVPTAGNVASLDVCPLATGSDGFFQPGAFLAYGPFDCDGGTCPCGGLQSFLLQNFIAPENILCFAPEEGDEPEYDPVEAASDNYLGPVGPGRGPVVRRYRGSIPDLNPEFGGDDRMEWLITYFEYTGAAPADARFCFDSDDGGAIVYDTQFLHANNVCRGVDNSSCRDPVPVTVTPGMHRVAVSAWNRGGGWGLRFKIEAGGVPVVDGDPDWIFHGANKPSGFPELECPSCEPEPVRNLTCRFGPVGLGTGLLLSWTNPPETDPTTPTRILINGAEVATVATDATSASIPGNRLPAGAFTAQVIHCGGVAAECSPFYTTTDGLIMSQAWLTLGPISNLFGCGNQADILGNHIAPSFIGCEYPAEGDEPVDGVDFFDPENVADGFAFGVPDPPRWVRFDDGTPTDGDHNFDAMVMEGTPLGDLTDHMVWIITYVEYTGAGGTFQACIGSDDGVQAWLNDELLVSNNACRPRGICDEQPPPTFTLSGPGVIRIAMGVWENDGGFGGSFGIQDEFGNPILDGDPDDDWTFHGPFKPTGFEGPCTPPADPVVIEACEENAQGGVDLSWTNPPEAPNPISITVNGVEVAVLPADAEGHTIDAADLPAGVSVARICVDNGSFEPVCCGVALEDELYINCGGTELTDTQGRVWTEDTIGNPSAFLTGPNAYVATFAPFVGAVNMTADPRLLDQDYPMDIFPVERWNDGPVEYTVNGLTPGLYEVTLLFMEGCCSDGCLDAAAPGTDSCDGFGIGGDPPVLDPQTNSSGCRVFDILINDELVQDQFSQNVLAACLASTAPGVASNGIGVSLVFEADAPDGTIKILLEDLGGGNPPENSSIKGIAIVPLGVPPGGFVRGDVDQSGALNLTDGIQILLHLFRAAGLPRPLRCLDAADADDSGSLNLTDGVTVFLYLFRQGVIPLPSPKTTGVATVADPEDCGPDPTGDNVECEGFPDYCQ